MRKETRRLSGGATGLVGRSNLRLVRLHSLSGWAAVSPPMHLIADFFVKPLAFPFELHYKWGSDRSIFRAVVRFRAS